MCIVLSVQYNFLGPYSLTACEAQNALVVLVVGFIIPKVNCSVCSAAFTLVYRFVYIQLRSDELCMPLPEQCLT